MEQTSIECVACFSRVSDESIVKCCNDHTFCIECFESQVRSQISVESLGKFIENSCKITCSFCNLPFTDKKVISHISDELVEQLQKTKEDVLTNKAKIEYEKKRLIDERKSIVERHRIFICENILTLHCKTCNAAIFDFEGCFAINCSNCNSSMCGWCLGDFSPDAHPHVKICEKSLHPGSYHGTFDEFNKTHLNKRRDEVIRYLNSIYSEEERNAVLESITFDLNQLNIQLKRIEKDGVSVIVADVGEEREEEGREEEREEVREEEREENNLIQLIDNYRQEMERMIRNNIVQQDLLDIVQAYQQREQERREQERRDRLRQLPKTFQVINKFFNNTDNNIYYKYHY